MSLNPRLVFSSNPLLSLNNLQEKARLSMAALYESGEIETEAVPCFCGAEGGEEVAARDRYGFPVRTVICMRCGLLRTTPRMSAAFASRFYTEHYRPLYDSEWERPEERFAHDLRRGEEMLAQIPGLLSKVETVFDVGLLSKVETVFDVGCAAGGVLEAFRRAGKQTAGCDMTRRYLDVGRANGLSLVEGGVTELCAAFGGSADLAVLSHVLEHFFDLKREFEEVVSAVNPGGFVLVSVPGLQTVPTAYRGDILLYLQNAHNYHFSATTLRYVLASCGVEVLVSEESGLALVRRPEDWAPGKVYDIPVPQGAGLENLSRILRFEAELGG